MDCQSGWKLGHRQNTLLLLLSALVTVTVLKAAAEVEDTAHKILRSGVVEVLAIHVTEEDVDLERLASQCIPEPRSATSLDCLGESS